MVSLSIIWKFDTCGKKGRFKRQNNAGCRWHSTVRGINNSIWVAFLRYIVERSPQPSQWNSAQQTLCWEGIPQGLAVAQLARAKTGPHPSALSFALNFQETLLRPSPGCNNPPANRSVWIRWAASWKSGYTGWKTSAAFHLWEWQPDPAAGEKRLI